MENVLEELIRDPVYRMNSLPVTLVFDMLELAQEHGYITVHDILTHPNLKFASNYTCEEVWRLMDRIDIWEYGWTYEEWQHVYPEARIVDSDEVEFKVPLPRPFSRIEVKIRG